MITVIGSLNMDLTITTKRYPILGETLLGDTFQTYYGGKGANQAVAAAKLGGQVVMIGCVGKDAFGEEYMDYLRSAGVNSGHVETVTDISTGVASITVTEGDNAIIIVPGANFMLTPEMIEKKRDVIAKSSIVVLQLEIPMETVEKVLEITSENGVTSILNPAPFQPLPETFLEMATYITPNEHEAAGLMQDKNFAEKYFEKMIITLGDEGAAFYKDGKKHTVRAPKVTVTDTTGAGDTFNGALAYFLQAGKDLEEAVRMAVHAASLSVTKLGAQGGMPSLEELKRFME